MGRHLGAGQTIGGGVARGGQEPAEFEALRINHRHSFSMPAALIFAMSVAAISGRVVPGEGNRARAVQELLLSGPSGSANYGWRGQLFK